MDRKVVTRFAPSPTGFMHVGNVRAALYEWLWARKNNGIFILRIEDTDQKREVEGSVEHIIECLKWLGLDYDAGPNKCEPGMCYTQSERLDIYKKYAKILIDKGHAYPDPYTVEELEAFRKKAEEEKRPFLYREHRPKEFGVWDGTKPLRFKTPEVKSYHWHDAVFGDLSAGPEMLDDFVLIKSDGYPTYNFAHIVDDIEMGINLVMRGQEYIASTPKYLSVYEALEVEPPVYACLPHIMATGGNKKLGKRDGAKDVLDYRKEGYLPDAMLNFLALLGWNPGGDKEIFTRKELIEAFDISRIQVSGAQMNLTKLDWINKEHIKLLPAAEIEKNILEWLPENLRNPKLVPIVLERISKWGDVPAIADEFSYLISHVLDERNISHLSENIEKIVKHLKTAVDLLQTEEDWQSVSIKSSIWDYASKEGRKDVLWPLRFALSGKESSPDFFNLAEVLGKTESIKRIEKLINLLELISSITITGDTSQQVFDSTLIDTKLTEGSTNK